jgi:hypothetical protein
MLLVYLDLKVGDATMKKIGEYALDIPAHVLSRSENLPSDDFHPTRETLRQQCKADLDSYVGGSITLGDTEYNDDTYDE